VKHRTNNSRVKKVPRADNFLVKIVRDLIITIVGSAIISKSSEIILFLTGVVAVVLTPVRSFGESFLGSSKSLGAGGALLVSSPAVVALVGSLFGIAGTALGKGLQNTLFGGNQKDKSLLLQYLGHSLHFAVFAWMWILGVVWTLDQCGLNSRSDIITPGRFSELMKIGVLTLPFALAIGAFYPLANLVCYGTIEGSLHAKPRRFPLVMSVLWYSTFGALLGFSCGFAFQLSTSMYGVASIHGWFAYAVVPAVYCLLYGALVAVTIHRAGGIGIANLYRLEDGLIGAMVGTLLGMLLSFVSAFAHSPCPTGDDMWLFLMLFTNVGALIGSFYPQRLQSRVRKFLVGHVEDHIEAITPVLKVILIVVVVLPWGAIIAHALNSIAAK
jgi:hypothetical protein